MMVGIWFAAVYNSHHYVLDIVAGITCGITGIILFLFIADKTSFGKKMIDKMVTSVT
jgi:membrane-associated phospholipid phosphatase